MFAAIQLVKVSAWLDQLMTHPIPDYQWPYRRFFLRRPRRFFFPENIFVIVMNLVCVLLKQQSAPASQLNLTTPATHVDGSVSQVPPAEYKMTIAYA